MFGAGFPSGSDEAIAEHDGELDFCLGPFARRHFPFLDDLAQDQENEFRRRLIVREMASGLSTIAKTGPQIFTEKGPRSETRTPSADQ